MGVLIDGDGVDTYRGTRNGTNGGGTYNIPFYSVGFLLDAGGVGDAYIDQEPPARSGAGTDRTVAPKAVTGFQIDSTTFP
ncbi:MAG TPA: hypothetical protein VHH36_00755 [Candidatus Thermoplasmatota archaeon]|nr:hypothetical protein [Candidatus Thermoplasmatota archaeon]